MTAIVFDADRKRALLDDFDAGGPLRSEWLGAPTETGAVSIAGRTGLHPAFVALVPAIGGHEGGAASTSFYAELLGAIAPGLDGLNVVRAWFRAVWDTAEIGPAARLRDTPAYDAASSIITLVDDSMIRPVDAKAWRAARGALSSVEDSAAGDIPFTEPVLAMAWDLDRVPGASADVFYGWDTAVLKQVSIDAGWSDADGTMLNAIFQDFIERATAELGPPTEGDAGWVSHHRALMDGYWAERSDLSDLKARYDILSAAAAAGGARVRDVARGLLIESARAAAQANVA